MKKIVKKSVSLFLAIMMLVGIMTVPAHAYYHRGSFQLSIPKTGWSGTIYQAYDNRDDANNNVVTLHVAKSEFPVKLSVYGEHQENSAEYTLEEYKTYYIVLDDNDYTGRFFVDGLLFISFIGWPAIFRDGPHVYATVKIAPPDPKTADQATSADANTNKKIIDKKLKMLLDEVDNLGFYDAADTPYGKELRAFLTGEWDGSYREENENNAWLPTHRVAREVRSRTYRFRDTDCLTYKVTEKTINVDYIGYKEVVPGTIPSQKYSLAVSYVNGEIEKWSLLNKQDSWVLQDVASGREYIDLILPLASVGSAATDSQAHVNTLDADGNQHMYALMPGGVVDKLV